MNHSNSHVDFQGSQNTNLKKLRKSNLLRDFKSVTQIKAHNLKSSQKFFKRLLQLTESVFISRNDLTDLDFEYKVRMFDQKSMGCSLYQIDYAAQLMTQSLEIFIILYDCSCVGHSNIDHVINRPYDRGYMTVQFQSFGPSSFTLIDRPL